ncbi:unnamed protein product [Prunus brigantina]
MDPLKIHMSSLSIEFSYGMVPPHVKITSSFVEGQNKCFE